MQDTSGFKTISFRCPEQLYSQINERINTLKIRNQSQYILTLIQEDIKNGKESIFNDKVSELLQEQTKDILTYIATRIDSKLISIENKLSSVDELILQNIEELEKFVKDAGKTVKKETRQKWYERMMSADDINTEKAIIQSELETRIGPR